ncbi:MAG: cytochrome b [Rhodocyclaceae bacterium]
MSYSLPAIALHWLMALAIVCAFCVGLYMVGLPFSPQKLQIYSWHKWAGVSIFLLALLRVVWRLLRRPPAAVAMPRWQQLASAATHGLLYLLMLAIPLSGWLMSSAKGVPTVWFGVLPLPDLLTRDAELGRQLATLHAGLNYTLAALVFVHAAAAIKHHFIDHDTVLIRMLPFLRQR